MKFQEDINEILACGYAYRMCGSSPCKDCDNFRHITTDKEMAEFRKCISEVRCQEAKEYNEKYDNFVKEYLNSKN